MALPTLLGVLPVVLYLAYWSLNPLRARLPVQLRRTLPLLHRPWPTRFAADSLHGLLLLPRAARAATAAADAEEEEGNAEELGEGKEPRWELEWHALGPRLTTRAFNALAEDLVDRLTPGQQRAMEGLYDAGVVWAAVGASLGLGLLLWEAGATVHWLWRVVVARGPGAAASVVKRAAVLGGGDGVRSQQTVIRPLIPGVTLPWAHAPLLAAAFLLGQVVHEPGHSLTGALSGLTTLSATVHLSPLLPSASVLLPSAPLDALRPREKARIAGAGCWHNVLFALGMWAVAGAVGWSSREAGGRVVLHVEQDSPLNGLLPTGAIVTRLDDLDLTKTREEPDRWTAYLTSLDVVSDGWCVPRASFEAQPQTCCTDPLALSSADPLSLCFRPVSYPTHTGHCLPPNILTTPSPSAARCPCAAEGEVCVDVDPREGVLRIGFVKQGGREEGIVWQGSREQVLREVLTSDRLPPLYIPPPLYALYLTFSALQQYTLMLSLTLAVLNLLPLPVLDGGLLLRALLESVLPDGEAGRRGYAQEEEEEVGGPPAERRRRRVQRGVAWGVGGVGAWVLGGMAIRLALGGYG